MTMNRWTSIGDYLLTRLYECGIETIFGVPGDFNLTLLELLLKKPELEWAGNCNELNAAYAADGYARIKGAGAVFLTYGVGDLSAINGIAGAFAEHVPVICVSGIPPTHALRKRMLLHHTSGNGSMEDVMNCMMQFTSAQARLTPANAASEIDRVLCTAMREKRPVYLQIPSDIVNVEIEAPVEPLNWTVRFNGSEQLERVVKEIVERLEQSKQPAMLIDGDAQRFGLHPQICSLSQSLGIPYAVLSSGRSIFDEQHPFYAGLYAGHGSPAASTIESSDCLLAVGVRFFDSNTGIFSHRIDEQSMISIEPFAVSCGGYLYEGVPAEALFASLGKCLAGQKKADWAETAKKTKAPESSLEAATALTHKALWPRIERFLTSNDVVLAEAGTSFAGIAGIKLPTGAAFISQSIWGSIGYTLPAMLGAMKASPERRHLLFIGDGSLQMVAQEISTMIRHRLKPIIFVINNDGYTIERVIYGPQSSYNDIHPWKYCALPAVFDPEGISHAFRASSMAGLDDVLEKAGACDGPVLIELMMEKMDASPNLVAMGVRVAEFDYGKNS